MRLATRVLLAQAQSGPAGVSSLPLRGWWKSEDYADDAGGGNDEGLWAPSASAGTSGDNDALVQTTAVNVPDNAAGPDFSGTADELVSPNAIQTFVGEAGWVVAGVLSSDTAEACAPTAGYSNVTIFGDAVNGFFYITFTDAGVGGGHFDGVAFRQAFSACATGGLHYFIAWYDGTDLRVMVDGVTGTPVAAANGYPDFGGQLAVVGRNYNASKHFDGRLRELMTGAFVPSSDDRDLIAAYFVDKFSL